MDSAFQQIKRAAKELNDLMGLDPQIKIDGTERELFSGLRKAINLINSDDDFSQETWYAINHLEGYFNPEELKNMKIEDVEFFERFLKRRLR